MSLLLLLLQLHLTLPRGGVTSRSEKMIDLKHFITTKHVSNCFKFYQMFNTRARGKVKPR